MRQNTNIFRVPPGGGAAVKTNGQPIRDAIMALPYKETGPGFAALIQDMAQTGQRVGGTSEQQVGEGRADAPVGTTLAQIEQAVKVLNAVHKRQHTAQSEEFSLLVDVFRDHPECLIRMKCEISRPFDEERLLKALNDCNLEPKADPNTASYTQRLMKAMAIKQLQAANPTQYDPLKVDTYVIRSLGFSNPSDFFAPPDAQQQPPPEIIQAQAQMQDNRVKAQAEQTAAQARLVEAQARARETDNKIALGTHARKGEPPPDPIGQRIKAEDAVTRRMDAQTRQAGLHLKKADLQVEDENRDRDRDARIQSEGLGLVKDLIMHNDDTGLEAAKLGHQIQQDFAVNTGGPEPGKERAS
jgi:hypothetical protein